MLVKQGQIVPRAATVMLLVALVWLLAGCNAKPVQWSELGAGGETQHRDPAPRRESRKQKKQNDGEIQIVPQKNTEVADLSPDDIVAIMRWIGFTDEHILILGTDMRDALLQSGRAKVMYKGEAEAIVAINGAQVYVQSRSRGSYVHQIGGGPFSSAAPTR